jgi:Mg-chelatase subunit ChlD
MPYFSFIHPGALWLLVLLVPIWVLALTTPRRLSPARFWGSLGLRTALILLLVLSLAGTQLVLAVDQMTTVFLVDSSDSISPSARAQAETFIDEALDNRHENDRAALVVFGENALVERAPALLNDPGRLSSEPIATHTDIEEALQLGMALFPADTQKRLVLLSDGGENTGSAREAAQLAATRGIPIEIVDLSMPETAAEALVTDVHTPDSVRDGQDFELEATVESSTEQSATLRVFDNQDVVVDREVQLAAGSNEFRIPINADGQGFRRYRVRIEPQQDNRLQNNESAVLVEIEGPPRVLLVEGVPGEAANLQTALQATNINAEVGVPGTMPTDLAGLSAYEAVVLVNVAARDLPVEAIAALPTYVRDLGKGLVMIGGDSSYGVGGYGNTPIEEALPVYMDVRNRQNRPDLALVFVIDKSGSMDACHCAGPNRRSAQLSQSGERKIDIAKEAVTQAAGLLGRRDTLGIVTFDIMSNWTLPATEGATVDQVAEAVSDVRPRGNTDVRVGLTAAEDMLNGTDARIKHVILLTDGWGEGGSNLDVAQRMNDNGITLSVVAAGSGSATFLENLALTGGGRYYAAEDMNEVPEIFLQETIMAAGNYIVERPFVPAMVGDSPVLDALEDGLPPLYGYNGSTRKDTARTVLEADDGSPVLAQWQFGLGRSVAWTSDTKGQWARDWVQWEQFPRFASQMVDWVIPTEDTNSIATAIDLEGTQATIAATVQNTDGSPREDLHLTATLLAGEQHDDTTGELPTVDMVQVAPGEYRATVQSPGPGTYFVQIQGETGEEGRAVLQHLAGLVVPYSTEYRQDQSNPALLADLRELTGGRELADPALAFDYNLPQVTRAQEIGLPLLLLALVLLPLDIAMRRLLVQRRDFAAVGELFAGLRRPRRSATQHHDQPDSTVERLSRARTRARAMYGPPPEPEYAQPAPERSEAPPPPAPPAPSAPERSEAPPPPTPPAPPQDADALARLREAKARARRRARGGEEK